ncbi:MAG: ATP-binding protein [Ignavibacteriales bacterium]|nr:ATP-binding protein [Ignavibacteriales bacterium]
MENPFKYWRVVEEDDFCNRKKELAELLKLMHSGGRAFMYSERRYGKTSLVKLALAKLPKQKYVSVYIDLWKTDSDASFITTVAKAYSEALSTNVQKAVETAKRLFSHLKPSITLDDQGNPTISFGITHSTRLDPEIDEILAAPQKIASSGKRVVIVFDEFQQILMYGRDDIERQLRSVIQHQKNISYIFLGSRKHVVREMFLKGSRPLYRSATQLPLGSICEEDWQPFIHERFRRTEKKISSKLIHSLIELTQGHPFYTQYLCNVAWEFCKPHGEVHEEMLQQALQTVLEKEHYTYTLLWESLTRNQQRFLRSLAIEEKNAKPFSSEFLQRYRLGSASSAQRVIRSLLDRDLVDHENGSYIILDRFLRLWLRNINNE